MNLRSSDQKSLFGGAFGPLAQYPGSGYGYATWKKSFTPPAPPVRTPDTGAEQSRNPTTHCMSTPTPPLDFDIALLLVETEANAAVDRRVLRDAGIAQIRILTSGVAAARQLAALADDPSGQMPDVVLCHKILEDMTGTEFVTLARMHPRLATLPVLIIAGNDSEAEKLRALSSGFSGMLTRPYSEQDLRVELRDAAYAATASASLRAAHRDKVSGDFNKALERYENLREMAGTPEAAFAEGMQNLHKQEWDKAIRAFQKALRRAGLKGEAELGMATAWKGKGDIRRYRHYLAAAGHTFARASQWHRARTVYARLLREDPTASSPFLAAADRLIREERYDEAAQALAAGYDISPDNDEIPERLAQACLFTNNPEYAAERIKTSLGNTCIAPLASGVSENIRKAINDQERRIQERRRAMERIQIAAAATAAASPAEVPRLAPGVVMSATEESREKPRKGSFSHEKKSDGPPLKGAVPTVDPMFNEEDAESRLFSWFPGLNEALTVAKTTWKLHHRSRKK